MLGTHIAPNSAQEKCLSCEIPIWVSPSTYSHILESKRKTYFVCRRCAAELAKVKDATGQRLCLELPSLTVFRQVVDEMKNALEVPKDE